MGWTLKAAAQKMCLQLAHECTQDLYHCGWVPMRLSLVHPMPFPRCTPSDVMEFRDTLNSSRSCIKPPASAQNLMLLSHSALHGSSPGEATPNISRAQGVMSQPKRWRDIMFPNLLGTSDFLSQITYIRKTGNGQPQGQAALPPPGDGS